MSRRPAAPAVGVVAHHRVPHAGQVDADLVRPTAVQLCPEEVGRGVPRETHEVRLGRPSATDDGHALSVSRVAADRGVDGELVRQDVPPRERRVAAGDASLGDRPAQGAVRRVGLGDEEQPRGVLVEPVDDPGALLRRVGVRRHFRAARDERVHERPGPVARRGVHHHPGRLVHDERCSSSNTTSIGMSSPTTSRPGGGGS
jgi:hypothetical protein